MKRNEQDRLDDVDQAKMNLLLLQKQLHQKDGVIIDQAERLLKLEIQAKYGNPGEPVHVQPDGKLFRLPPAEPPKEGAP